MKRTQSDNKQFHALINQLGIDKDTKKDMVFDATDGRSESSKDLTHDEALYLISLLREQLNASGGKADKMRKKIIVMFRKCGYVIPSTGKVDMNAVESWCVKYGHAHKALNDYTLQELPKLVSQAETMASDFINS